MSPIDQNTKLHTARGPICKLCVHKFYVHEEVCKAIKTINGAKIQIAYNLRELQSQGANAKDELHREEDHEDFTFKKIKDAE